jgi:hypothetical protein
VTERRTERTRQRTTSDLNLRSVEVKAFVPARDFALSKQFYLDIGFVIPWSGEDLAYVSHGECSFLLQRFYVREHADNFMMHLLVASADDWWQSVEASGVVEKYGVRLGGPEDRPWGMRDFTLTDPTGVLWRIAQNIEKRA